MDTHALGVKHHHFFKEIEEVIRQVDATPPDIAEELKKSEGS